MSGKVVPFLIGLLAVMQGCAAQTSSRQTFGFFRTESGQWRDISVAQLQDHLVASKVVCNQGQSEIDIVWNSESGDWAAFDKYRSDGTFFTRTVRFAQFSDIIHIVKRRINSKPVLRIDGDEAKQYEYLLQELSIWTRIAEFPYKIPQCAADIFRRE